MRCLNSCLVVGTCLALSWPVHAQTLPPVTAGVGSTATVTPKPIPGADVSVFNSTIQGTALDSTNRALPDTAVRLRNARTGRVIETQVTDKSGGFVFKSVDPGTYVVEIVGNDHTILAASPLINVSSGDVASAIVKLPFKVPPSGGLLGRSLPHAAAIAAAALAAGVLGSQVVGAQATCDTPQCGS